MRKLPEIIQNGKKIEYELQLYYIIISNWVQ